MGKERAKYDFSKLKLKAPLGERAYRSRWGGYRQNEALAHDFSLEEIIDIIKSGSIEAQRDLSMYYYRTNGEYRNNIDFLASLPLYDSVVIPLVDGKTGSKTQIINNFKEACDFVDILNIPVTFNHITKQWLKAGIYSGILRTDGKYAVIQDLPVKYCRTRFKTFSNLNILEFNLMFFDSITDEQYRDEAVATFPEEVQKAWKQWHITKTLTNPWVMIGPESGGVCFCFADDPTPLLLASIPQLKKLDDAVKREEKRDENELHKLLIQRMPIGHDDELIFELDEVEQIHASVATMLKDVDTVDVLTTFGETSLESLQQTSAATQSTDRIEKYKNNAYDALGRSSIMFNADGSSTLAYSIQKDEALMITYLNVYEAWLRYVINERFSRAGLKFDFEILPTTVFNREKIEGSKFRGAQYGYSKMFAGIALGIKQRDLISLMEFENDYLKMSEKMIPLQSSYTTSGNTVAKESEQNNGNSSSSTNITNVGGRPELPDQEKSEKTQANIAAQG